MDSKLKKLLFTNSETLNNYIQSIFIEGQTEYLHDLFTINHVFEQLTKPSVHALTCMIFSSADKDLFSIFFDNIYKNKHQPKNLPIEFSLIECYNQQDFSFIDLYMNHSYIKNNISLYNLYSFLQESLNLESKECIDKLNIYYPDFLIKINTIKKYMNNHFFIDYLIDKNEPQILKKLNLIILNLEKSNLNHDKQYYLLSSKQKIMNIQIMSKINSNIDKKEKKLTKKI